MKLNWFEKLMVNSSIRPIFLRKDARFMLQLGGNLIEGGRVLEIGCGRGFGVDIIFSMFNPSYVEAFDFDPHQVHLAKKRLSNKYQNKIHLYEASATRIPSDDNHFDAVFDFAALHHISDNSVALNEISRVLKPGGQFFFLEMLSSFTLKPIMRLLTLHPPEAQFTWPELSMKLKKSNLGVSKHAFLSSHKVVGVAFKEEGRKVQM
jgi:ubiquinone/menaquinone biosynthesis C-methylase UbiE